jgi:TPR repeat protein
MNNLAYGFYEQGKLGKKNLGKALKLYKVSAASGNHWANENLAQFYMFGLANETKSYEKTISHFKLARIEDDGTDNFIDLQIFKLFFG